jgi:methyltransferase family protein
MASIRGLIGRSLFSRRSFEFFQRHGVHVLQNHFYSPVPDTSQLARRTGLWEKESEMPGVDLNPGDQLAFLETAVAQWKNECRFPMQKTAVPHEYFLSNGAYGLLSAAILHCMIRHYHPKIVIEVGSGNSTYVSARACLMNEADGRPTRLVAIEPYPNGVLQAGFPGLSGLVRKGAEEVGIEKYLELDAGDILFIDSSHVVRMGNDVVFLYLEVLPRLRKGVVVHIHDIFFPFQYPRDWILERRWLWSEQYLLQAFLAFNRTFEIRWCGSYMHAKYLDRLKAAFPPPPGLGEERGYFSSSLWMQKVG